MPPPTQARVSAASVLVADESRTQPVRHDPRRRLAADRTRARRDPPAARPCVAARPASRGRPRSICTARRTATTLDSVGILPPSPINLFSAGAPIPIWVRNDLPYPVNVVLLRDTRRSAPRRHAGERGHRRTAEQHARAGARPGTRRQRRGHACSCSCAAAPSSRSAVRRSSTSTSARTGRASASSCCRCSSAASSLLGVVRTVLRLRADAGGARGHAAATAERDAERRSRRRARVAARRPRRR